MRTDHLTRLARFRRVRDFLATEPALPGVATPLAELEGVIERLSLLGARQEEHHRRTRALTIAVRAQARAIRTDMMRPIALAARTLRRTEGGDALRTKVRMPNNNGDYESLVHAARGMAAVVEEHAARFVSAGLDADFVTRLRAGAEALTVALGTRAQERQRRVASTQGQSPDAIRGAAIVRLLDALVQVQLRDDVARRAEWRSVIGRTTPPRPAPPAVGAPAPTSPQQVAA